MQITFDPLDKREADYVRDMLGNATQTLTIGGVSAELTVRQMADLLRAGVQVAEENAQISPADSIDLGADKKWTAEELRRFHMTEDEISAAQAGTGPVVMRFAKYGSPDAPSAVPLPPTAAPLPAAATLFSTAPEAQQDGAASAPIVPPPPVPSAPPVAVPPAPAAPAPRAENGDLDKDGLPWDQRIHSGSKEKNKDGTWRQRRNLPEGTKETVEAELRRLMAIPMPAVPVSAIPLPPPVPAPPVVDTATSTATTDIAPANASPAAAPAGPDVPNVPAPPASAPATAPIPTPPVPPAPTAAAPSAPVTFAGLMKMVTAGITERKFTEADVHAILAEFQLGAGDIGKLAMPLDNMREALQQVAQRVRELTGEA